MKVWHNLYAKISTLENIFTRYGEFRVGKKQKKDVLLFDRHVEDNLFALFHALQTKTYTPGVYTGFYIRDPKLRFIHKATVIDRVVHHIVSYELEQIYEPTFIAHSYACRKDKGTHKAVMAFQTMARKASKNNTKTCWVLKCDIKKFFDSINHHILLTILAKKIADEDFFLLLQKIITSFYSDRTVDIHDKKGIPIGNLTSQFFSNIYLNELDQFVKHTLKVQYYIRYADDFVFLSPDKAYLESLLIQVDKFLYEKLDLELHPQKVSFHKFRSGVDFLGYIAFPHYILPRTKTKRRVFRKIRARVMEYKAGKIDEEKLYQTVQSYLGYLSHANSYLLQNTLKNILWYWLTE